MKVRVADLGDEVRHVEFVGSSEALREAVESSSAPSDRRFVGELTVSGDLYRTGTDVHFSGAIACDVDCECSRCLDEFTWRIHRDFRYVIVKAGSGPLRDDVGIDHYDGDEVDLGPLAREQVLLGLGTVALCSADCRGLCAGCGANLNREDCTCGPS